MDLAISGKLVEVRPIGPHLPVRSQQEPAHAHGAVVSLRGAAPEPGAWILALKLRDLVAQGGAARGIGRRRVAVDAVGRENASEQAVPFGAVSRAPRRAMALNECGGRQG